MKFVSFHTHTTYSYADGFGTVAQHVQRVHSLGMRALALSEHGNVNSHAALERECHKIGIKPIFGIEAYLGPVGPKRTQAKTHITLFAQDDEGYHNLNKLVTQSYLDAHYWPTVSVHNLRKHAKGLVAFSGCSDSLVSCSLLGGKFLGPKEDPSELCENLPEWEKRKAGARRRIEWFLDVFGPDRFFLEVQRFPQLDRTCALNPTFAELSKATGVPLIATADVHYPYPGQNEMQKVLHASRRSGSVAVNEQEWEYSIQLTYPESDQEIIDDLRATGLSESDAVRAVDATSTLADACTVELPKAKPLRFKLPTSKDGQSKAILCGGEPTEKDKEEVRKFETVLYFKAKIKEGWKKRKAERPDLGKRVREYSARVDSELKVIADKDFCDYFLVLADLVQWAKSERDITVGPGRGSAAGSVICYLLGITEIDPLHPTFQRMIFERFIDPNRTDMPDIDLDFDDDRRHEIVERAREIYGPSNVCNVANHIGYRAKKSLQGVAVAYGLPKGAFDPIAKRCVDRTETDERVDDSIFDAIESYASDPAVAELLDKHGDKIRQACQLEGNEHSMGVHAGGFIISSEPIPEVCAIYTKDKGQGRNREVAQVIPYEKRDAEHLGLLKMDFLGLTTMGVVGLIRSWINMPLDNLYALYYKDFAEGGTIHNQIMSKFLEDDLVGIFQYEGGTTRQVVREVRPATFDELAACVALSRPGPMYGKGSDGYTQTQNYIAVKNGEREWRRIHSTGFDRHVEWTYGQIVYQEQIMWILRDLAGFPTDRVLRVRKIIGKKLGEHQFAELWEEFRNGCAANGVSEEDAASVWGGITTAAGYAFCVTGDTVLEKGGSGGNDPNTTVTVKELYTRQQSKTPIGKKIRSGKLHLLGMDDDGRIRPQTLLKVCDPVSTSCIRVTVASNRNITCSTTHRFLTQRGYVLAQNLSLNDSIVMDCGKEHRHRETVIDYKGYKGYYRGFWKEATDTVYQRANGRCEDCGKRDDGQKHTLEFSHVLNLEATQGNFALYHSDKNIRLLCNPCHKMFDYRFQKTRVKRWQKGRATQFENIVSIEDAGVQEVYDIELKEDAHNYIGNGFVNHNNTAHSYSYALVAWWSMYFKIYNPTQFFAAILAKNGDGKDNIARRTALLQDSVAHNIQVGTIDVVESNQNWEPRHFPETVLPGFSQLPGVGLATADDIVAWRGNLPFGDYDNLTWDGLARPEKKGGCKGVGPVTVEKFKAFVSHSDPFGVHRTEKQLEAFRKQCANGEFEQFGLPSAEEFYLSNNLPEDNSYVAFVGLVANIVYRDEIESIRTRTGKSVDEIRTSMDRPEASKKCTIFAYDENGECALRVSRWRYDALSERIANIATDHHIVVAYGRSFEGKANSVQVNTLWILDPD